MTLVRESGQPEVHGMPIRLADRLLAEALCAYERDGAEPLDEAAADEKARRSGGDFEHRVVHRATAVTIAGKLSGGLRSVKQATAWIILAGVILAGVTGAGAARAALGAPRDEPVNFFWVFVSLLGLQTVLLLAWFALMLLARRSVNVSPLGGAALALGRWLAGRTRQGPYHMPAIHAAGAVFATGGIGKWTLSAISHAMWLAFNVGCLVLLVLLLSARQYTFTWETTILTSRSYVGITQAISIVPDAMGIATPTPEQIKATENIQGAEALQSAALAWSGLLVGSIAVYGFAPRLLLLGFCLSMKRRTCRRYRLNTAAPGYLRLRARLMPVSEAKDVVTSPQKASSAEVAANITPPRVLNEASTAPPAIVAVEIERDGSDWPPRLHDLRWTDLGFADARDERKRVLDELGDLKQSPHVTVIVCSLTTTPDRGIGTFVRQINEAVDSPLALLLTSGHSLRRRADAEQVALRVDDWRELAEQNGISGENVIELDLEHLTDLSGTKLAGLLGASLTDTPGRRIEQAFDLIIDSIGCWKNVPDARLQAELHQRIAQLYRAEAQTWRDHLGLPSHLKDLTGDITPHVKRGADRVLDLLPPRLKRSPKWLAAGAMSGALGCVAASVLLSPVAIGALPMWSAIGAAIAAVAQPATRNTSDESEDSNDRRALDEAVRAAAL